MSQSPVWWRALVLSTIVLCIVFAVRASGEDKKTGTVFAVVDFGKVSTEYREKTIAEGELSTKKTRYAARLARRNNMPLLTEEEQKELDRLHDKDVTQQTDAEKKRVDELTKKGVKL